MNAIQVRCINCNKRLFDIDATRLTSGIIRIRCSRCKCFATIDLFSYHSDNGIPAATAPEKMNANEHLKAPSERNEKP